MELHKILAPFARRFSTIESKYPLTWLIQEPNRVYATDTYVLLEVEQTSATPKLIDPATNESRDLGNQELPPVDALFPQDKPDFCVKLDARYLERMAKAFKQLSKGKGIQDVTIEIRNKYANSPVTFTARTLDNKRVRGLIMPVRD